MGIFSSDSSSSDFYQKKETVSALCTCHAATDGKKTKKVQELTGRGRVLGMKTLECTRVHHQQRSICGFQLANLVAGKR